MTSPPFFVLRPSRRNRPMSCVPCITESRTICWGNPSRNGLSSHIVYLTFNPNPTPFVIICRVFTRVNYWLKLLNFSMISKLPKGLSDTVFTWWLKLFHASFFNFIVKNVFLWPKKISAFWNTVVCTSNGTRLLQNFWGFLEFK